MRRTPSLPQEKRGNESSARSVRGLWIHLSLTTHPHIIGASINTTKIQCAALSRLWRPGHLSKWSTTHDGGRFILESVATYKSNPLLPASRCRKRCLSSSPSKNEAVFSPTDLAAWPNNCDACEPMALWASCVINRWHVVNGGGKATDVCRRRREPIARLAGFAR